MALTIAYPTHPNQTITEFPFGPWKARLVKLTFDSSYLTTGEVLNATDLGWNTLIGAMPLTNVGNADGTLSVGTVVRANTAQTALTFQAQESAAVATHTHTENTAAAYTQNATTAAGGAISAARLAEVGSTTDLSAYHGNFLVLGA